MIQVTCEAEKTLLLSEMTEFQGGLKTRTESDFEKIQSSIRKYGIAFPFFVWENGEQNHVLDGHGRLGALERLEREGEEIPPLPVVYILADDEVHAKNLLLRLNSRYGEITVDGIREFLDGVKADLDDVRLPDLPDIGAVLNEAMASAGKSQQEYEPPKPIFDLYCPECGEKQDVTDDELREIVKNEN